MTRAVLTAVAVAVLLAAPTANAKRSPTFNERVAITRGMPAWLRALPAGCVVIDVTAVSNNGRYAEAGYDVLSPRPTAANDPCAKYFSNGSWILRKDNGKWRIIYNGSAGPSCALHIPRDLTRCLELPG